MNNYSELKVYQIIRHHDFGADAYWDVLGDTFSPTKGYAASQRIGRTVFLEYVDITVSFSIHSTYPLFPASCGDCIRMQFWIDKMPQGALPSYLELFLNPVGYARPPTWSPHNPIYKSRYKCLGSLDVEVKDNTDYNPSTSGVTLQMKRMHEMRLQLKIPVDFNHLSTATYSDVLTNLFFVTLGKVENRSTGSNIYQVNVVYQFYYRDCS